MRQTFFTVLSFCAMAVLLTGCGGDIVTFNSKGQIGVEQRDLIIISFALMLIVVIPAIVMTLWFGWKYRESNTDAEYLPDWSHSTKIEIVVWGVPCLIIAALAYITYVTSHSLDPYKKIDHGRKSIDIQVIAEPFKWVFIYPDHNIATVNEVYLPENQPVTFHITSDFTMNSFFIPQLGGQVYAMAGMRTQLNLIANELGTFDGLSANYSGHGFSKMHFKAHSVSQGEYDAWIQKVKASNKALDFATLQGLAAHVTQGVPPNMKHHKDAPVPDPVQYFSPVQPDLFKAVIGKYMTANHTKAAHDEHHQENTMPAHAEMTTMAGGHQ